MKKIIFILILCFEPYADAFNLPERMDQKERVTTLEVLGLGTSMKLTSDPYPLGGHSGFEVGLSEEFISMEALSGFGDKHTSVSDLNFTQISVGKGLYYDLDVFFNFIPLSQESSVSGYGGLLRWSFLQAKYFPAHVSAVIHANSFQIESAFVSRSFGADLLTAFDLQDFSVYFGVGRVQTDGTFLGGNANLTDTGDSMDEKTSSLHTFFGTALRWSPYFLALEIDRYNQTVYALKLGLRY